MLRRDCDSMPNEQTTIESEGHEKPASERPIEHKSKAMSSVPVAIPERLGWRTHLPPVQVHFGMAERCAQIMPAKETPAIGAHAEASASLVEKRSVEGP